VRCGPQSLSRPRKSVAKILYGFLAGLLSALVTLIFTYLIGVVVIAVTTREFFATVLASVTVWPLMLLFVLLVPTVVAGVLVSFTISLASRHDYLTGAIAGVAFSLALLSGLLPLIFAPANGDFISIISRPTLSAAYGLVLGLVAARLQKYGPTRN